MISGKKFENVIEFVNFFFCQTFKSDEYANQVKLYNTLSSKEERKRLKEELILLQQYDWQDIKWFLYKNCGKKPKNEESVNFIIQIILDNLA